MTATTASGVVIAVRHARAEELEELHERLRVEWTGDILVSRGVAYELSELSQIHDELEFELVLD